MVVLKSVNIPVKSVVIDLRRKRIMFLIRSCVTDLNEPEEIFVCMTYFLLMNLNRSLCM